MNNMTYNNPPQPQQQQVPQPQQQIHASAEHAFLRTQPPIQDTRISINLDEDAQNILESITPELREAFVTIAIKHFRYDPMYQNYFMKIPDDIQIDANGNPGNPGNPVQQPAQTPPIQMAGVQQQPAQQAQHKIDSGFTDW
jgi:hypothetical protein